VGVQKKNKRAERGLTAFTREPPLEEGVGGNVCVKKRGREVKFMESV